jgi:hypothetical protein
MMSNWKQNITPSEWFQENGKVYHENGVACIAYTDNPELDESQANMSLCAEAGTVCNETGKTPRELQQERDEALGALRNIKDVSCDDEASMAEIIDTIERLSTKAIAKIEGEQT